jgi:hypothetical protein
MVQKRRSLAGVAGSVASEQPGAIKFPAHLVSPPQSQLTKQSDAVSERIGQVEAVAVRLAEGFGVVFTLFELNPKPDLVPTTTAEALTSLVRTLTVPDERVSLERRSGVWGLYYQRGPTLVTREYNPNPVLLRDAPLEVRERFLLASERFFREYFALCEHRLGRMHEAVASADRALQLVRSVQLT